jgi:hypothetical protein
MKVMRPSHHFPIMGPREVINPFGRKQARIFTLLGPSSIGKANYDVDFLVACAEGRGEPLALVKLKAFSSYLMKNLVDCDRGKFS